MYIEISKKTVKNRVYEYILLRKSTRDKKSGKIIKETIANLTNEPVEQVMSIVNALKDNKAVNPKDLYQNKKIAFSLVVYFIMNLLGIVKAIGKTSEAKIAIVLVAARVIIQSSRLQALKWTKRDYILDVVGFSKEEKDKLTDKTIYKGLDYLYTNQVTIENELFKSYYKNNPPKRVFYDVTSSYVEGEYEDSELIDYGYNRDKKKGTKQVVIGLLCDEDGHAISIHTYKGNTNDVKTFADQLDKLKRRFKLDAITVVGDGGMIKSEDIGKIKELGYDYITSIGKPSIKKLINDTDSKIDMSLFDEELQEMVDEDKGVRYILRQNPIRRDEIRETRQSKITRLQEYIDTRVEYYNTHYKAKAETLHKNIDKKISNLKLSQFISYEISYKDDDISVTNPKTKEIETKIKALATVTIMIDEKAKQEIAELDGCYIVTTSLIDTTKDTKEDIHKAYKTLIKVENAFKTIKTEYLEIRPLYLRTDSRIKGHIFLSMLAYNTVLKLRGYISKADLDFKDTIQRINDIATVKVQFTKKIAVSFVPTVGEDMQKLFDIMKFKLPNKISY